MRRVPPRIFQLETRPGRKPYTSRRSNLAALRMAAELLALIGAMVHENVQLVTAGAELTGELTLPEHARGLVLFAHGSGSSRLSPRNRFVAKRLNERGYATLLFDLLTPEEDQDQSLRFDIALLAERLAGAIDWSKSEGRLRWLPRGLFGASTGAAAALIAAVRRPRSIRAIVSRGGRPDLAEGYLHLVQAPSLFIVGGRDEAVLAGNRRAAERMRVEVDLTVVQGATHLFEEPGALEHVAGEAAAWFDRWLVPPAFDARHV